MKLNGSKTSAFCFISEVTGYRKIYVFFLLLVQIVLGISSVFFALLFRNVIDSAVSQKRNNMLMSIGALVFLVIGQILFRALLRFLEELSRSAYENAFKERLFRILLQCDYGAMTTIHSGEWMNRLTSDTVVVADGIVSILPGMAGMISKLIGALVVLVMIEPLVMFLLIPGGTLLLFLTFFFRKHLKTLHKKIQEKDGKLRAFLQEHLKSLMVIKAFCREENSLKQAVERMKEHQMARLKKNRFSNLCNVCFGGAMQGAYVLGAVYGAISIYRQTISYGSFIALLQLIGQIQSPFANITGYLPKFCAMVASAERLMEAEAFTVDAEKDVSAENKLDRLNVNEILAFGMEKVCFTYQNVAAEDGRRQDVTVLRDYSIEINMREFVALTGPSGCGKSTVLKLFIGLYKIESGERYLLMHNSDSSVEDATYKCLFPIGMRELFAYVPQGNQLMSGSIRDIITFSDTEKRKDEIGIYHALEIACAKRFVSRLENGLDTVLGELGLGLSEGQMQRLAIARAIYSNRPILLLDEATSALDAATELSVLENLRNMTEKTVILITHRTAALSFCDRILSFEMKE